MPEPLRRLLTAQEVADVFAVTSETVTRWAELGKLPGIKSPGGQWRFRRSDVEAFIEASA